MIQEAAADLNIDLSRSWFIGDKASDILCGQRAGLRTILVTTGYGLHEDCKPDYRARDIASAVDWIVIG
jgi:D-glycero-D-manno-heptose 1,7-bisphosphate phosphatase